MVDLAGPVGNPGPETETDAASGVKIQKKTHKGGKEGGKRDES